MCKANENLNDCSGVGGELTVNGNGDGQMLTRPNEGQIDRGAEIIQTGTNKGGGHTGPSTGNGKTIQNIDAMQMVTSQTRDRQKTHCSGYGYTGRYPGEVQVEHWAVYRLSEGFITYRYMGDRVIIVQAVSGSGAIPMVCHDNGAGSRPLG